MWNSNDAGVHRFVGGGGGKPRFPRLSAFTALLALAALSAALIAGSLFALAPARADGHSDNIQLVLSVDDADNVIAPNSEFTVSAQLHFTGPHTRQRPSISNAALHLIGPLEWESVRRSRLAAAAQNVGGGGYDAHGKVVRFDGRTLISLGADKIEVIDLETQEKVGEFTRPTMAEINSNRDTTAGPHAGGDYPASVAATEGAATASWGRALDVWQEDADTAWLFVGAPNDTVGGHPGIGRLYIYKVDYSTDPPTIALERNIEPHPNDYRNDFSVVFEFASGRQKAVALFGWGLAVSADGSTLAVAAPDINEIGAVYVYERPGLRTPTHGPGGSTTNTGGTAAANWADWGDLTQNSGTKLSAIAVPDWDGDGDTKATMAGGSVPQALRHWGLQTCPATCQEVWSFAHTDFGKDAVALSADGSVLVVGAQQKMYDGTFTPGSYDGWRRDPVTMMNAWRENWDGHFRNGEAYVFQRASSATYWKSSASMLAVDTATNAYRLQAQPWGTGPGVQNFGARVAVSNDGASVAISAPGAAYGDPATDAYTKNPPTRDGKVYVFNRASAEWPQSGLTSSPGATLGMAGTVSQANGNEQFGGYGVAFRADGARLAVTHEHYGRTDAGPGAGGAAWVFSGASGAWRDADTSTAQMIVAPTPVSGSGFGYATYANEENDADETGDEQLAIGGGANSLWLFDGDLQVILNTANGGACTIQLGEDNAPRTDDDTVVCELAMPEGTIVIPAEIPDGSFTISGSAIIDGQTYRDTLEITIGRVKELAEVKFDFATDTRGTSSAFDDRPFPSSIAAGQSTTLQLQILNENGVPSEAGSAVSVLVTTTAGELSAEFGGGCQHGTGADGRSCSINTAALTDANSGRILLNLRHTGEAAMAEVRATVFSATAETFDAEPLTVTLTGPPTSLTITEPTTGLLNVDTADEGADKDDRDLLTLTVIAADQGGRRVDAPTNNLRARLTGPDGQRVTGGVELEWPLGGADNPTLNNDGERQVRINVNRSAAEALANGEYTLEVRAGSLTATQTFSVSSSPAALTLGELEGTLALGEQITLTAAVLDADGNPVPNGTPVEWSATDVGTTAVLVQLSAEARTTNGRASASWLVLSDGAAAVRAQAGTAVDLRLLDVAAAMAAAAAEPPSPADGLAPPHPGFATWFGQGSTTAAALLDDLPGIASILLWSNSENRWLRYARSDGQPVPGSVNFEITNGAVLWIAE